MKLRIAVVVLVAALAAVARADQVVQNVQQALKDQGFYYGEVTGEKDADTTAAIRRYQIRNGLQISGDLNDETLKSLGVESSGARAIVKASPTRAPAAPETSDLRAEPRESSAPTNPLTGQPFPEPQQDRQLLARPDYDAVPARPAENFAGTPFESAPPQVQRNVIISAQSILARRGLYRGAIDGAASPDLDFSLRAYQARARLPVTGRLDLDTLAALELLPGAHTPIYVPRRRPLREAPVRGEWIPDR
ncbi:MAG TPA: peptidoglycan-binding domain-containing protein [Chthoniobacterales bacterium]|nr:peptidoglycan-binding domain-containing protein [Chthoniobacterales bacterium]